MRKESQLLGEMVETQSNLANLDDGNRTGKGEGMRITNFEGMARGTWVNDRGEKDKPVEVAS